MYMRIHEEAAKRLRNQGYSFQTIGELLGISKQRVNQILQNYINSCDPQIKESVKARDSYRCQLCSSETNLIVHHIDKIPQNNTFANLITLCESCHRKQHPPHDLIHCSRCKTGIRKHGSLCQACNTKRHRDYWRKTHGLPISDNDLRFSSP